MKKSKDQQKKMAIGVFDSGLGGLTVVKALMKNLPFEDIVYFGDTARVPYGTKSKESIIRFSSENVQVLLEYNVKMIVVACNSSSSYALPNLRKSYDLPIVGVIEPGALKAVEVSQKKMVGVIATPATINSQAYTKQIKKIDRTITVIGQACPLFVPLVEEGWFQRKVTSLIAREYLQNIKKSQADALILGCTHYPLLKTVLGKIMGTKVVLIDSAEEVALKVKNVLENMQLSQDRKRRPRYKLLISDASNQFRPLAKKFLGCDIRPIKRVLGA